MSHSAMRWSCVLLVVATLPGVATRLHAATLPPGFSETVFASGLSNPTAMQFAPDGRLFVCQQGGALRVVKNGTLLVAPFVDLDVDDGGERGLLGVAFDPNFAANQYVYVYYTATTTPRRNRISRFTANGDVALANSEFVVMELDALSNATNHNGGAIAFGADGKLYVAVGENANPNNAQLLDNRHGKMLRINADGSIPADNPTSFGNISGSPVGANRAIWAVGLRNPFTFAFNPGGTGPSMLINDVGAGAFEEINDGIAGANYGWPLDEGPETPPDPDLAGPRYYYDHGGGRCAITGGDFYVPATVLFPGDYLNDYFFADFCAGWIRRLDTSTNLASDFASGVSSPVDLKVWEDGALYYLARGSGQVYRVAYGVPGISQHPASTIVTPGQTATFSVVASGAGPVGSPGTELEFAL